MAACAAILLLTRSGLFTSLDRASVQGEKFMRQYYAANAGEDLAERFLVQGREIDARRLDGDLSEAGGSS